jgi:3-hydroxyacyl-CoA dehydrogenase
MRPQTDDAPEPRRDHRPVTRTNNRGASIAVLGAGTMGPGAQAATSPAADIVLTMLADDAARTRVDATRRAIRGA